MVALRGQYARMSALKDAWSEAEEWAQPARPVRRQRQVRLRPEQVDALVEAYVAGSTYLQLAGQFGVSQRTVRAHLRRREVPKNVERSDAGGA